MYNAPMNKKAPELHAIDGTRFRTATAPAMLPEQIRKRIPIAEWLLDPYAWDKQKFVTDAAEFLFTVYGIGNDQDKHTLALLADQLDLYIKCSIALDTDGIVSDYNGGQTKAASPYITIRNKALSLAIQLMNELGLTPRSRLAAGKVESGSIANQFLVSPFKQ